jgi:hypothetical protein
MRQKVHVKPTPIVSLIGILVGFAFLIFGIIFLIILIREDSTVGIIFMIFWFFVISIIIAFNFYNLIRRKDVIDIETESMGQANDPGLDFESKLRKLESLKKDGLINEEEYSRKRVEIFTQKW